ncbi:MAG: exodeoxyribonuclease III [Gemmatimonadetes bacterium]|nr:exodeoxyribonuclease III [Gemmatimonadota bacterium]
MRIATWNVNSVKAREARVVGWLQEHRPDVLCLQELKTTDEAYPVEAVRGEGYQSAVFGQKAFNGVALLSPHPIADVRRGLEDDDPQARLIGGVVKGVTVYSAYFPNGRTVGSEAYDYKLGWMARLLDVIAARHDPGDPVVLTGDFNVAPDELDANDPGKWEPSVLCHPAAREALERIRRWGFVDVVRKHNPEGGLYSWWDYRRLAFPRNDGLRIDHIFATMTVAERSTGAWVDRNQRKGRKTDVPSDHAPVVAEFDWNPRNGNIV